MFSKYRMWIWSALILVLALLLRGYKIGETPAGLYVDEASIGYNAYSLWETGRDEYGKSWPVFIRSFGNFSSSLYTYFTMPMVGLMGLSVISVRMVSLLAGVGLVGLLIWRLGLLAGFVAAILPVLVFYSRGAFEANFALLIFMSGFWMCLKGLKEKRWFIGGMVLLSVSGWAYHAERFLSVVFLVYFSWLYWKRWGWDAFWRWGVLLAIAVQLPVWWVSFEPGTNSRLYAVGNQGSLGSQIMAFIRMYVLYFSPHNLFSRPDPDLQRSFPDLSVMYWWMIIPAGLGIWTLWKRRHQWSLEETSLLLLGILAVIPGAVTKDYFSTLRVLPIFVVWVWILTLGLRFMLVKKWMVTVVLVMGMLPLTRSLVLLHNERDEIWGYQYQALFEILKRNTELPVVVDNSRLKPMYIYWLFYTQANPRLVQKQYDSEIVENYYDDAQFNGDLAFEGITFRPVLWEKDIYIPQLLVGDTLAISEEQAEEHYLQLVESITDVQGKKVISIYMTNPQAKCNYVRSVGNEIEQCQ